MNTKKSKKKGTTSKPRTKSVPKPLTVKTQADNRMRALTYNVNVHDKGIIPGMQPKGHEVCDFIVVCSGLRRDENMVEWNFKSLDGLTQEAIHTSDIFKVWCAMAGFLAAILPDGAQKELCGQFYESAMRAQEVAYAKKEHDGKG